MLPALPSPEALHASLDVDGYAVVRGLVGARAVAALNAATDALEATASALVEDARLGPVFFEVQSASGRKREAAVTPGALRKITGPSKREAAFARLRSDRRVVELVRAAGVASAQCVVDQVNLKHPLVGTGFPFHQDGAFLHGDARDKLARFGGVNVVIALDDADADNGGFTVLGGTHRGDVVKDIDGYDTSTSNEGRFDQQRAHTPSLCPGDAVIFSPRLAHGSGPNRSPKRRRMVTLWFVGGGPAST